MIQWVVAPDGHARTWFRQPNTPLSVNQARGQHWGKVYQQTKHWKAMGCALGVALRRQPGWESPRPVTVHLHLSFHDARRRDPHNYTGTVVKAVVDGLVASKLIPDDTPEWVTVTDPTVTVTRDDTAILTLYPGSPDHGQTET